MLNQVQLIGRLGNEPEVRTTASGDKVANFSVATTETWVKDGERKSKTTWITDLTEAFILLDEAVAMHAIVHRLDVTNARTAQQLSFLHTIQPSVH